MADWQWLCLQRIELSQIPGDLNGIIFKPILYFPGNNPNCCNFIIVRLNLDTKVVPMVALLCCAAPLLNAKSLASILCKG